MGFRVTIAGGETIVLGKDIIRNVQTSLSSPSDSRAKSTKDLASMLIMGSLYTLDGGENTETIKLFEWSQAPAVNVAEAYRDVTVEVMTNNQIFRKIQLPNAFVVDYSENYSDKAGYGEFRLVIRQKSDKTDAVKVESGLPLPEEPEEGAAGGASGEAEGPQTSGDAAPATAPAKASVAEPPRQSLSTPGRPGTTGGIVQSAAGNVVTEAVKGAVRSAVSQAAQQALNKADPSGTAAAAAHGVREALQQPNPAAMINKAVSDGV